MVDTAHTCGFPQTVANVTVWQSEHIVSFGRRFSAEGYAALPTKA